jgi:hypothetical protein
MSEKMTLADFQATGREVARLQDMPCVHDREAFGPGRAYMNGAACIEQVVAADGAVSWSAYANETQCNGTLAECETFLYATWAAHAARITESFRGEKYTVADLDNGTGPYARMQSDANGRHWVQTIHPYDLAEYHYAFSSDGRRWQILWKQKLVTTITTTDPTQVLRVVKEYDRDIVARIDHS